MKVFNDKKGNYNEKKILFPQKYLRWYQETPHPHNQSNATT
jgi:aspartokinase-like uncharacterized kinase